MSYLDAAKALYDTRLREHFGRPRGRWRWTVSRLEREFGFPFPTAYREFLLWMGEDRKGPFRGSACFPTSLARNTEWLPGLLAENQLAFPLPERFLAFFMHQGYIAAWFALPAASDDPPVWMFNEGTTSQPEQLFTFSEWLLDYLRCAASIVERRRERARNA
jgi:hypothetical protein